jgi:hypothetical protein
MTDNKPSEKGQVLVLIVLALVVLLGFTAQAVDGGMLYSDRRHAQNSGDASSLAGGSAAALTLENSNVTYGTWSCSNSAVGYARGDAVTAAISRAADNGFAIDDDPDDDHNGVTTDCGSETHGAWTEKYIDVTTEISTTTRTSFAHCVYPGKLQSRIMAVTRIRPRAALAFGNAIVALNPAACSGMSNGVVFDGNIDVIVEGGGIFSNGCLKGAGGSLDVDVTGGGVVYVEELDTQHADAFNPEPTDGGGLGLPDFAVAFPVPDCSALPNFDHPSTEYRTHAGGPDSDPEHIHPGNYSEIDMTGAVFLEPGLYCLYGDFDAGNNNLTGNGVTIYMVAGGFTTDGGADAVFLSAPEAADEPEQAIPGLLISMAKMDEACTENNDLVKLRGNSNSIYDGTIYAPCGDVDIAGTPDMPAGEFANFNTQIVANNVFIGGNAYVNVNFDEDTNYIMPTNLELHR